MTKIVDVIQKLYEHFGIVDDVIFDFDILVEQKPFANKFDYLAKVLHIYIQFEDGSESLKYPEIVELGIESMLIKNNNYRNVTKHHTRPFIVNGSSKILNYEGYDYVDYRFKNLTMNQLKSVEEMRVKFNIVKPHEFVGKNLQNNSFV
jgi:hypothetical protein